MAGARININEFKELPPDNQRETFLSDPFTEGASFRGNANFGNYRGAKSGFINSLDQERLEVIVKNGTEDIEELINVAFMQYMALFQSTDEPYEDIFNEFQKEKSKFLRKLIPKNVFQAMNVEAKCELLLRHPFKHLNLEITGDLSELTYEQAVKQFRCEIDITTLHLIMLDDPTKLNALLQKAFTRFLSEIYSNENTDRHEVLLLEFLSNDEFLYDGFKWLREPFDDLVAIRIEELVGHIQENGQVRLTSKKGSNTIERAIFSEVENSYTEGLNDEDVNAIFDDKFFAEAKHKNLIRILNSSPTVENTQGFIDEICQYVVGIMNNMSTEAERRLQAGHGTKGRLFASLLSGICMFSRGGNAFGLLRPDMSEEERFTCNDNYAFESVFNTINFAVMKIAEQHPDLTIENAIEIARYIPTLYDEALNADSDDNQMTVRNTSEIITSSFELLNPGLNPSKLMHLSVNDESIESARVIIDEFIKCINIEKIKEKIAETTDSAEIVLNKALENMLLWVDAEVKRKVLDEYGELIAQVIQSLMIMAEEDYSALREGLNYRSEEEKEIAGGAEKQSSDELRDLRTVLKGFNQVFTPEIASSIFAINRNNLPIIYERMLIKYMHHVISNDEDYADRIIQMCSDTSSHSMMQITFLNDDDHKFFENVKKSFLDNNHNIKDECFTGLLILLMNRDITSNEYIKILKAFVVYEHLKQCELRGKRNVKGMPDDIFSPDNLIRYVCDEKYPERKFLKDKIIQTGLMQDFMMSCTGKSSGSVADNYDGIVAYLNAKKNRDSNPDVSHRVSKLFNAVSDIFYSRKIKYIDRDYLKRIGDILLDDYPAKDLGVKLKLIGLLTQDHLNKMNRVERSLASQRLNVYHGIAELANIDFNQKIDPVVINNIIDIISPQDHYLKEYTYHEMVAMYIRGHDLDQWQNIIRDNPDNYQNVIDSEFERYIELVLHDEDGIRRRDLLAEFNKDKQYLYDQFKPVGDHLQNLKDNYSDNVGDVERIDTLDDEDLMSEVVNFFNGLNKELFINLWNSEPSNIHKNLFDVLTHQLKQKYNSFNKELAGNCVNAFMAMYQFDKKDMISEFRRLHQSGASLGNVTEVDNFAQPKLILEIIKGISIRCDINGDDKKDFIILMCKELIDKYFDDFDQIEKETLNENIETLFASGPQPENIPETLRLALFNPYLPADEAKLIVKKLYYNKVTNNILPLDAASDHEAFNAPEFEDKEAIFNYLFSDTTPSIVRKQAIRSGYVNELLKMSGDNTLLASYWNSLRLAENNPVREPPIVLNISNQKPESAEQEKVGGAEERKGHRTDHREDDDSVDTTPDAEGEAKLEEKQDNAIHSTPQRVLRVLSKSLEYYLRDNQLIDKHTRTFNKIFQVLGDRYPIKDPEAKLKLIGAIAKEQLTHISIERFTFWKKRQDLYQTLSKFDEIDFTDKQKRYGKDTPIHIADQYALEVASICRDGRDAYLVGEKGASEVTDERRLAKLEQKQKYHNNRDSNEQIKDARHYAKEVMVPYIKHMVEYQNQDHIADKFVAMEAFRWAPRVLRQLKNGPFSKVCNVFMAMIGEVINSDIGLEQNQLKHMVKEAIEAMLIQSNQAGHVWMSDIADGVLAHLVDGVPFDKNEIFMKPFQAATMCNDRIQMARRFSVQDVSDVELLSENDGPARLLYNNAHRLAAEEIVTQPLDEAKKAHDWGDKFKQLARTSPIEGLKYLSKQKQCCDDVTRFLQLVMNDPISQNLLLENCKSVSLNHQITSVAEVLNSLKTSAAFKTRSSKFVPSCFFREYSGLADGTKAMIGAAELVQSCDIDGNMPHMIAVIIHAIADGKSTCRTIATTNAQKAYCQLADGDFSTVTYSSASEDHSRNSSFGSGRDSERF